MRDEFVSRHPTHRAQHTRVRDSLFLQQVDHLSAPLFLSGIFDVCIADDLCVAGDIRGRPDRTNTPSRRLGLSDHGQNPGDRCRGEK